MRKKTWERQKPPDKYPTRDWLCEVGAYDLRESIRNYWAGRGHKIEVRVESLRRAHNDTVYTVRSNLISGLPPE